jgi:glutamine cyclotransferase
MKAIIFSAVLISSAVAWIDLNPAYKVHTPGQDTWKLVRTFEKEPHFVEGFEMVDDGAFIESVGLYSGSKLQRVSLEDEFLDSVLE